MLSVVVMALCDCVTLLLESMSCFMFVEFAGVSSVDKCDIGWLHILA